MKDIIDYIGLIYNSLGNEKNVIVLLENLINFSDENYLKLKNDNVEKSLVYQNSLINVHFIITTKIKNKSYELNLKLNKLQTIINNFDIQISNKFKEMTDDELDEFLKKYKELKRIQKVISVNPLGCTVEFIKDSVNLDDITVNFYLRILNNLGMINYDGFIVDFVSFDDKQYKKIK